MASGIATASGSISVVDEGGSTLSAKSLQFNLKDKTAVLANGRLFYREDNIHLTAENIKKTGPETYRSGPLATPPATAPLMNPRHGASRRPRRRS